MPYPVRCVLPVWFSSLAAAAVALLAFCGSVTHASAACTTGPNSKAAPGSHWYYVVDRVSQRKCWFVGRTATKARPPAAAKAQSSPKLPQAVVNIPKRGEPPRAAWNWLEQPPAPAPNPGPSQAVAAAQPPMPEPQAEVELQASFNGEAPLVWPVLAASESEIAEVPSGIPQYPGYVIAVFAAALGLAGLAGRLIVKHCILFSA